MNHIPRKTFNLPAVAAVFLLTCPLATPSWADMPDPAVKVEINNTRNNPVQMRSSIARNPVYCSRHLGSEHTTPREIFCYNALNRKRIENIPKGYSLVITDVMIADSQTTVGSNDRYRIAIGKMADTETAITSPGILIRSGVDTGAHHGFHTSPMIFHQGDRFAAINNGDFAVYATASGYLVKTNHLNYLF